jgi:hypothetical protein
MRSHVATAVVLALLAPGVRAATVPTARPTAAPLSAEQVQAAIEVGSKAETAPEQYILKVEPTWTLNFDTPFLRVAQFAFKGKKRGVLKESDVPAGLRAPEVHVLALAMQQPGATEAPQNIEYIVLHKPGSTESLPPLRIQTNLNRARTRGDVKPAKIAQSVEAVFLQSDFRAGNEIRVQFGDRTWQTVALTRAMLDGTR